MEIEIDMNEPGMDKKLCSHIAQFRKAMTQKVNLFLKEYSYQFCLGLAGMFPGGQVFWEPQERAAKYCKNGIFYDVQGPYEPETPFLVPAEAMPPHVLANYQVPYHMESHALLDVIDAVEAWRDNIRKLMISHKAIQGTVGHAFLTINDISEFAKRFLCAKPDGMSWVEAMYMVCVNPVRTGIEPNLNAMAVTLNNLKDVPKEPYFCMHKTEITGMHATSPYSCKVMHHANGAVKCVLYTPWAYLGQIRAIINLARTPDGFTWEIGSWYNKLNGPENASGRNKGWGKECLSVLARELRKHYGEPVAVSYVWNGQNDFVGRLVTEKWHGVCKTPAAVLKNECADSWDSHIYELDRDAFLQWLS